MCLSVKSAKSAVKISLTLFLGLRAKPAPGYFNSIHARNFNDGCADTCSVVELSRHCKCLVVGRNVDRNALCPGSQRRCQGLHKIICVDVSGSQDNLPDDAPWLGYEPFNATLCGQLCPQIMSEIPLRSSVAASVIPRDE